MNESRKESKRQRWRVNPPPPPLPRPEQLPPGLLLPNGKVLVFAPHRECPCADCNDAFEALKAGTLREATLEEWDGSWLP